MLPGKLAARDPQLGDYHSQVSLGNIPGVFKVYKFGRGLLKGVGKFAPIAPLDGTLTLPAVPNFVTPTSSDINDVYGGTGAWSVHITGLGETKEMETEIVRMNEQSTKKFFRVFRVFVYQCGVAVNPFPYEASDIGNNIGDITLTHAEGPVAMINARMGQTLMAVFTVPKDHVALMWSADTNMGKDADAVGYFFLRDTKLENSAWRVQGIRDMYRNTVGKSWRLPSKIDELTDIIMAAEGSLNDTVSGTFEMEIRRIR